jgi:hypothetical protein
MVLPGIRVMMGESLQPSASWSWASAADAQNSKLRNTIDLRIDVT